MSEVQGEVRVRNVTAKRRSDNLVESLVEFGGGAVRLGVSLISLPLAVLPAESRQHVNNAARELMYAFASLPRDFAEIAGESIEKWAREVDADDAPKAPRDEMSPA